MWKAISVVALVLPSVAIAEPIPEEKLRAFTRSCMERCENDRSFAFCAETCGCMVGEASRHMTNQEFDERERILSRDSRSPVVGSEMRQIAQYCHQRTRGMRGQQ